MLPSDLNKFKEYLTSTATLDEEHLAELLLLLQENYTRSRYIMTIEELSHVTTHTVKPSVEVHEYMTTTQEYVEKRIAITSYYTSNSQREILEHLHRKLCEKIDTQPIVLYLKEYTPQVETGKCNATGEN